MGALRSFLQSERKKEDLPEDKALKRFVKATGRFSMVDEQGVVRFKDQYVEDSGAKVIVPRNSRKALDRIWDVYHRQVGHRRGRAVEMNVSKDFYMMGLQRWVAKKQAGCPECLVAREKSLTHGVHRGEEIPKGPGEEFSMDLVGPMPDCGKRV